MPPCEKDQVSAQALLGLAIRAAVNLLLLGLLAGYSLGPEFLGAIFVNRHLDSFHSTYSIHQSGRDVSLLAAPSQGTRQYPVLCANQYMTSSSRL